MNSLPKILFELGHPISNDFDLFSLEEDGSAIGKFESINTRISLADFNCNYEQYAFAENNAKTLFVYSEPEPNVQMIKKLGLDLNQSNISWGIIAEGRVISKGLLNEFSLGGMDSLFINLDGLIDAHESLNSENNSFIDSILAIFLAVKDSGINFSVISNINAINLNELSDILHLLESLHVKSWLLNYKLWINNIDVNSFNKILAFVKQNKINNKLSTSIIFNASSKMSDEPIMPVVNFNGKQNIVIKPT